MIPNTALMAHALWANGSKRSLSILDPFYNGFTFRLPAEDRSCFGELPESLTCSFFQLDRRGYETVTLTGFTLSPEEDEESRRLGAAVFRMETDDPAFRSAMGALRKTYTAYLLARSGTEDSLMEQTTGKAPGQLFRGSLDDWKRRQTEGPACWQEPLLPVELALPLDTPEAWNAFLTEWDGAFFARCFRRMALDRHPIAGVPVTHVAIGGDCPMRFPEEPVLTRLLERAFALGLQPVLRFAPMEQCRCETFRRRFLQLSAFAKGSGEPLELELNDLGAALLLRELEEAGELSRERFRLTAGPLLNKTVKDPRMAFLAPVQEAYAVSVNNARWRRRLREEYGFSRFSYEVTGGPVRVEGEHNSLYLPLYQTNSAPDCTRHAVRGEGDRGAQCADPACPGDCGEHVRFYPENIPLIGIGNTLYGCSMKELNDSALLNGLLRSGIDRLLLRM